MADGEDPQVDPELVAHHLTKCPSCRRLDHDIRQLRRTTRVRPAPVMADISSRVVKANRVEDPRSRWVALRGLLVVVALQIVVLAAPALFLGDEAGAAPHDARHLGAFSIAYAVGLLVVAIRPARARTMLPVAQVLGLAIVISAVVDIADGSIAAASEIGHIPEVLSVAIVWLLAVPATGRRTQPSRRPTLRPVQDTERRDEAV